MRISGAVDHLTVANPSLKPASKGIPYTATLSSTGGVAPVTWALAPGSGPLPPGITLNSAGALSGTPTTIGTSTFTVQVSDSGSPAQSVTVDATLTVADPPRLIPTPVPPATTGVPYSVKFDYTGGASPVYYGFMSERWSCCVHFDGTTGLLSGMPRVPGSFTGTVSITDAAGNGDRNTFTLVVNVGPLYVSTTQLPDAKVGWVYATTLAGEGGDAMISWSLAAGSLPPGMSLNSSSGEIRGIPTAAGTYSFTVQVNDPTAGVAPAQKTLTLNVQP